MITALSQVALGGAFGAMARYLTGVAATRLLGPGFPWGTMTANLLGSLAMGLFVTWAANRAGSHLAPLVQVGLLGGFTTFSSFSLDTVLLIERGQALAALGYVLGSVLLALAALLAGMMLGRGIFA